MTGVDAALGPRKIEGDWYEGTIPANAVLAPGSYIETTYSFVHFRSRRHPGMTLGKGAAIYRNTRLDVGPEGSVEIGDYAMLNSVEVICESHISVGAYTLVSWNVVLMDSYRVPRGAGERRIYLDAFLERGEISRELWEPPKPIAIGTNVWLGHDVVVLPGVSIGEGSVIGARSVVAESVPAYVVAAGNPARVIRGLRRNGA